MVPVNSALRQQIAQAFVAHRLNNSELVDVTSSLREVEAGRCSPQQTRDLLTKYGSVAKDVRFDVSHQEVESAVGYLHLDSQLASLTDDKAWTPYQRSLYRRLSDLEHDPVPVTARRDCKGNVAFVQAVQENFECWDGNRDGALSNLELDKALADPKLAGGAAAAAVVLRRQGVNLATCVKDDADGVTRQDLDQFLLAGIPENGTATVKVNRGFASMLQAADTMAPAPPLESEDFDPEMTQQGRAGACVLLSTLASKEKDSVREMFHSLPGGQVEVRFADGGTEIVRDLTLAERLYHAKGPEGGRWPGLLEVAIGQRLFAKRPSKDGSFRSSANGIPLEEAGSALHGVKTHKVSIDNLSLEQTREQLLQLTSGPKPWVAGSRSAPKGQDSVVSVEELFNGISNNHAYTIKGFDAESDTVWLRNPWHHGEWVVNFDHQDDGVFSMPLRDFYSSYRWISSPVAA